MPVDLLSPVGAVLALAALVLGISKTSVGGFGAVAVAAFALVMPAKESTAAVLLLLILGDVIAVWRYRRNCDWTLLRRLLPSVLPGVVLGAGFIAVVDDHLLRRSIGVILTVLVLIQLWLRWRQRGQALPPGEPRRLASIAAGSAAGFTTMAANAAGPVMTLYLLAARVDKRAFVGTNAWFFLLVNLSKTPFSAALGLFPASTFALTAALASFVLLGTWIGTRIVHRLTQSQFDLLAMVASALAAFALVIR